MERQEHIDCHPRREFSLELLDKKLSKLEDELCILASFAEAIEVAGWNDSQWYSIVAKEVHSRIGNTIGELGDIRIHDMGWLKRQLSK